MDIKEQIEQMVDKIKNDDELKTLFKENPIEAIEKVLGVDLPDDLIEKIVAGVKAKLSVDSISDAFGAFKKLF